jgi:hypothetical protein
MDDNGQTSIDIKKRISSNNYELAFIIIHDDFKEIILVRKCAFFICDYLSQLKLHLQIHLNFQLHPTEPALIIVL